MVKVKRSHVRFIHFAVLLLGAICVGVGLYSHSRSKWKTKVRDYSGALIEFHETCGRNKTWKEVAKVFTSRDECPDISREIFYIVVIILCFILSVVATAAYCMFDMQQCSVMKLIVFGYNITASILALSASIVYISSAISIENIYRKANEEENKSVQQEFQFVEKLTAGGLTFLQSILHLVLAIVTKMQKVQQAIEPVVEVEEEEEEME